MNGNIFNSDDKHMNIEQAVNGAIAFSRSLTY